LNGLTGTSYLNFYYSGLSIVLEAGKDYAIEIISGTFGTPPTATRGSLSLYYN
jgi:hypothetical protein